MDKLPCAGCRGLCCGPVAVTEEDLKKIKKKVKGMPTKIRDELKNQKRYAGTCIFYDLERDRCGIYSHRPEVCKMFGYYEGLSCFKKPELATKKQSLVGYKPIGILSIDYKWDFFI